MFHYRIQKRMYYVFLAVMLILFVMVVRFFYIQVFKYNKLSSLSYHSFTGEIFMSMDRVFLRDENGIKNLYDTELLTRLLLLI